MVKELVSVVLLPWLGMQSVLISLTEQATVLLLILCFIGMYLCVFCGVFFCCGFFYLDFSPPLFLIKTRIANNLFPQKQLKFWWGRVGRERKIWSWKVIMHVKYSFEVAWGTWGLVLLALCPFLQSLLVFLMQCNSVARFRYIVCQGRCISPKKEFRCLSCCTKN